VKRMRKNIPVFMAVLAGLSWLFAFPTPALGQGDTWVGTSLAQLVEGARWRLGALRVNAALSLSNFGYDSDVYYGYYPERVPDFTFSAGTAVQLLLPFSKKAVLEVFDSPQYMFYLDSRNERGWSNTFQSRIHFALERFYFQAGGGTANVRRRMSPELNINIREKSDSLNGLILWQASQAISFALLCGGTTFDYGDAEYEGASIAEALNRRDIYSDLITYIQPNPRVRFFIDGQYGDFTFAEAASESRASRSYALFGGLDFIPREEGASRIGGIQGGASLGYTKFDLLDPGQIDGSGFTGAGNLSVGIMKMTMARVLFSRGFQFSIYSGGTYYIQTAFGVGVTRLISRHASFAYDLSLGRSSYPAGEEGGGASSGIVNQYTTHTFNLNIGLSRNLAITLLGTIGRRIWDRSGQAINRNFIGVSMVYGAPTGTISAPTGGISR
jgi:hypothetical protein